MIHGEYFSIRILVKHPSMTVADLTETMGDEPDYSREPLHGHSSFWSSVEETMGKRDFFSEVSAVISWLEERDTRIQPMLATGGSIEVIVQLPGDRSIGGSWKPSDMARAVKLGVSLGVEVFPSIRGVTSEA